MDKIKIKKKIKLGFICIVFLLNLIPNLSNDEADDCEGGGNQRCQHQELEPPNDALNRAISQVNVD